MAEPIFLTVDDILHIHHREIENAGGALDIRDAGEIEAAVAAPQQSVRGEYLMDIFDMAASYVVSICIRHPFLDGNKRTALASSLIFLYLNGYEVDEKHPLELAELILDSLKNNMQQEEIGEHFRNSSRKIR